MRRQILVPMKSGGTFTGSENRKNRRRTQQRRPSVTLRYVSVRIGDVTVKPVAVETTSALVSHLLEVTGDLREVNVLVLLASSRCQHLARSVY